nr:unnamed protein product [Digitaria exilis]
MAERTETAVANYEKNLCALEEERFGEVLYDGEVLDFVETPFGFTVKPGDPGQTNDDFDRVLPSIVVSLALFDGNKMIFACSGIPLPRGKDGLVLLTRFVTSAHLVKAFKVEVRLPDNKTTDGFLGLYDDDIAIVTCLGRLDVCPIDLNFKEKPAAPSCPGDSLAGRAFMSGSLMAMHGSPCKLCNSTWIPDDQRNFKAVLGGPLIQKDAGFIGLIYDFYYDHGDAIVRYSFLSLELLCERLDRFEILNPKQLHFRGYSLPEGVSSIVPSGFMKTVNRIRSYGYPMPPPLVLEFNGRLLNRFEERFGDLLAWKGYPYGNPNSPFKERVWRRLPKQVVTDISRRVVSLASFDGYVRSFACTGLLIKWHGSKTMHTVILTSASLVRNRHNEDNIDKNLRAGIGGPLINFDGGFFGMNFYDGSGVTPFLPKHKIVQVLRGAIDFPLPSERYLFCVGGDAKENMYLFSLCSYYHYFLTTYIGNKIILDDRWPVPKPFWYHGALDVDRYHVPMLPGRHLD